MAKLNWRVEPEASSTFIGLDVVANTRSDAMAAGEAAFLRHKAEMIAILSEPADDATDEDRADLAKGVAYWRAVPCPVFTATKLGRA